MGTSGRPRRAALAPTLAKKADEKNLVWLILDGEMHEVGDPVPPRERFVIPRDNIPNKHRKQLCEQFMRRTHLIIKESICPLFSLFIITWFVRASWVTQFLLAIEIVKEHEPWCNKYMQLYQELRENWERLYWDEGYSKKIAQDHANCESPEDDD